MRNFITNSSPTCLNGITQYQYNANDNLLNDGKHNYLWDAADRLIQITDLATGVSSEFTYDGYSRRTTEIEKDANGNITQQLNNLWCGESLCAQQNAAGQTINRFFAQGEVQNGKIYLYAQDQVGSVYALIDSQGNVAGRTAYDPYGNITYQTGTQPIMAYAGLYQHKESGLYLATYRAYNPATARWINHDPIKEAGGLNIYAYVGGDPINFVDLLGLETEIIIWQPYGWAGSSFGHVSANINGKNYSWGPRGWDTNPSASDYANRQTQFRSGVGGLLDLTSVQESGLTSCLDSYNPAYDPILENCGTPFKECLATEGIDLGYPLFPADIGNAILNSDKYLGSIHYEGPSRSFIDNIRRGYLPDAWWAR